MFYLMYSGNRANLSKEIRLLVCPKPVTALVLSLGSSELRERVLHSIADPNIALLLVILGLVGIYAEFCAPGLCAPGIVGAILVLLGVTALSRFPLHWQGVVLMVLGPVCCLLEARHATRGILTAAGALTLALGAVTLIDAGIGWPAALALAIPFALISSFLFSIAFRARRNKLNPADRIPATLFKDAVFTNTQAGKS
jgi:membrane-bound ClpP family serine protease